jgi:2-polyprenyl-6-methoxyphenol hydroxylase-like FAD-dependent oxidoreductase
VRFVDFCATTDRVTARMNRAGRQCEVVSRFLVGCDGARSTVRDRLGIGWRGGSYRAEVILADLELAAGSHSGAHVVARHEGLLFLFPLGELASWRLLATRLGPHRRCP